MKKEIDVNGKTLTFKASAATNILFKRAFKEDILIKMSEYTKNIKDLKKMQARIAELKLEKENLSNPEVIEELNKLMNSEVYVSSAKFMNETLPKLAFVMFAEANYEIPAIFAKLNDESYLEWLLTIDQADLLDVTGQIMEIWQIGARTTSKPKN